MKKNYFLIGSVVGIISAFLFAYYLMGKAFFDMLESSNSQKYYGIWGPLTGALTVLACAWVLDRKEIPKSYWISGLLMPVLIYTAGMIDGCLINWLINGNGFVDFFSWFFIPFYWLAAVGVPSAALVGSVYYFMVQRLNA